jgi:TPR repeat protein
MRHIVFALALTMTLVSGAVAGPFEDVGAAYERGDYATALRLIRPLAEQGGAKAQYNLGQMYRDGQGVPQDYAEAVKWYRLAAEQGYADA